jgi:hypothetical protein
LEEGRGLTPALSPSAIAQGRLRRGCGRVSDFDGRDKKGFLWYNFSFTSLIVAGFCEKRKPGWAMVLFVRYKRAASSFLFTNENQRIFKHESFFRRYSIVKIFQIGKISIPKCKIDFTFGKNIIT